VFVPRDGGVVSRFRRGRIVPRFRRGGVFLLRCRRCGAGVILRRRARLLHFELATRAAL
jgi:hypothetical protein